ncbi:RagB/SusD family nutrient uptake outer membrane protein [Lunatimonas salinarum]|uniref:RagB/SusD family nutrient uptake outer membrane protein n=1 Tax=Lunatimonas salinarum TaxID=1774590 RepID=UPI001ADFF2EE|nr:RagB/SusD family nutrient uptake outer membrane protein [Lunatimonas salinarum]
MKKLHYIYIIILVAFLPACEDFLDKNPPDQLSSEVFWESREDFDFALTAVYATLQNGMFSYGMPNWDALTDNGFGQHNYWGSNGIVQGNIFPSTGGYITDIYNVSYRAIARINIFLRQLEDYSGDDLDESDRSRMVGEARFIRAYYYLYLYKSYGEVPLVTEPLSLENQLQPKASASEVKNQIVADLESSISILPDVHFASNGGRVVKSSAELLLARLHLYDGYLSSTESDPESLARARVLLESVMGVGYSLDPEFTNVFRDGSQEGNQEIIFSIKFLAPNNFTPMDQWFGDWLVVSPLQNLVDEFEFIDPDQIGQSDVYDEESIFHGRDPRLRYTIFEDFVKFDDGTTHSPSNNRPTGYGVVKFLSPDLVPYGYATRSQQDWVMMRYADVLLLYAETVNELEGPTTEVYESLNLIRARVGMPPLPNGLDQSEMRDRIRHERRVELAFEGMRYFDLKRWKIAHEVLDNVTDGVIPYNFEERFYHWPLPQSEIDRSQGVLIQNPDY